jgi:6,7-dimethyl-8-ribityllumazine synthase
MAQYEGTEDATGQRFAIVVSTYNEFVTGSLLQAAIETLTQAGAKPEAIDIAKVPGAFEIPLVARRLAKSRQYDAIICLGAVIRGETAHFDYICNETSRGIAQASWDYDVPVVFGVLTTLTAPQALERAGSPERNKGAEAARTAIAMVTLLRQLSSKARKTVSRTPARRSHRTRG